MKFKITLKIQTIQVPLSQIELEKLLDVEVWDQLKH